MSLKRVSQLSQPGLEVVIPPTPTPPPKVYARGPPIPEKDRGSSASPLIAARGRGRGRGRANWQPPVSAWSDSPATEVGSLFPRSAYFRQSPWPLAQDGSNRWPSSNGQYIGAEKRTFAFLGRTKFWFILGPIFVMIAISLAIGLGVGLGFGTAGNNESSGGNGDGKGDGDGNRDGDVGVASASPETAGSSPASTAPSPTASVLVLAPTPITCPDANGTMYQSFGNAPFLVLCDTDYNSNDMGIASATDDNPGSKDTETVEECIDACSHKNNCVGAGWGKEEGKFTCWMKGSLGGNTEEPNWFFVIKQQGIS